jgi:hypothetical protein
MPTRRGRAAPPAAGGRRPEQLVLLTTTILSLPVAFQYPASVARLVRIPVGYLRSRRLKKYHSFSPIFDLSAHHAPHVRIESTDLSDTTPAP